MKHEDTAATLERPGSSSHFASRLLHRALSDRKKPMPPVDKTAAPDDGKFGGGHKADMQAKGVNQR